MSAYNRPSAAAATAGEEAERAAGSSVASVGDWALGAVDHMPATDSVNMWEKLAGRALESNAHAVEATGSSTLARSNGHGSGLVDASGGVPITEVLGELDVMVRELREQKRKVAAGKRDSQAQASLWEGVVSDLKREVADAKRQLTHSAAESAALGSRLAEAEEEAAVLRQQTEDSRIASMRSSSTAANRFLGALMSGSVHRSLSLAMVQWRGAMGAVISSNSASLANRKRACAVMIVARDGNRTSVTVTRLSGALRTWAAATAAISLATLTRTAKESAATTRMVRACYAADKLGIALGVAGAWALRHAWWVWYAAAISLDGEISRDESEILRTELSTELRANAELQQKVTSLELAAVEAARFMQSTDKAAADVEARSKAEREVREAKRKMGAAEGAVDELTKELSTTQLQLDELKIQNNQLQVQNRALKRRGAAEETNAEDAAARTTALVALKAEMELLRKFSDMASGGRWLARWRIWLAGLKRKRAEFRAAASFAARRPAIAPAPELLAERLRERLGPARRRTLTALCGRPPRREACSRALWRWRTAAVSKGVLDAASAAAASAAKSAIGPAVEAAARSEAAAAAARDEVLWARGSTQRASEAEGMIHEAIAAGDMQTRRVLQLQRAVGATRRTLAACLLRSSLSAKGRSRCAYAIFRWVLALGSHARHKAVMDAKSARDAAKRVRHNADASESHAKETQAAASSDVDIMKKRVAAAERSRGQLRDQLNNTMSELEAERRQHTNTRHQLEQKLNILERSRASHEARSGQLEIVQGEKIELEGQLRTMRQRIRESALAAEPAYASSCGRSLSGGGSAGGEGTDVRLHDLLREVEHMRQEVQSSRTPSSRTPTGRSVTAARATAASTARRTALPMTSNTKSPKSASRSPPSVW